MSPGLFFFYTGLQNNHQFSWFLSITLCSGNISPRLWVIFHFHIGTFKRVASNNGGTLFRWKTLAVVKTLILSTFKDFNPTAKGIVFVRHVKQLGKLGQMKEIHLVSDRRGIHVQSLLCIRVPYYSFCGFLWLQANRIQEPRVNESLDKEKCRVRNKLLWMFLQ